MSEVCMHLLRNRSVEACAVEPVFSLLRTSMTRKVRDMYAICTPLSEPHEHVTYNVLFVLHQDTQRIFLAGST
jgi:hypothetical protein